MYFLSISVSVFVLFKCFALLYCTENIEMVSSLLFYFLYAHIMKKMVRISVKKHTFVKVEVCFYCWNLLLLLGLPFNLAYKYKEIIAFP